MSLLATANMEQILRGLGYPVRQAHLTRSGLNDSPGCTMLARYINYFRQTHIEKELYEDENLAPGSPLYEETDSGRYFEAIAAEAPLQLFNRSGSVQEFAKGVPFSEWGSILLGYYAQDDDSILARIAGIYQGCHDVRELWWGTNKELGQNWDSHPMETLPGLLVIHCFSRQVVEAEPGCEYVALSYVWGSITSRGEDENFEQDLHGRRLPQTVQDAMNVVRVLGLRFLWIDRYCIDDTEPGRKHYMVGHMDAIYERAYLTIIAASGEDSNHGLPSVSRSYEALENGKFRPWNGVVYSKLSYHHLKQVESSRWSTRGWTYQEGLLSRRRLIFTDDGAISHIRGEDSVRSSYGIFAHINEYSRRQLTRPSDLLSAFLGVFRAYKRLRPPTMHIQGIPFLPASDGNIRQPEYGLLWRADSRYSLRRLRELPSWTWAGWSGWSDRIPDLWDFDSHFYQYGPYQWLVNNAREREGPRSWGPSDIILEVLAGEQLRDISDHFRAVHKLPTGETGEPAPILYLTAWSTTITAFVLPEFSVLLEGGDLGDAVATFDPTVESLCNSESQVNGRWTCEWTAAVICWSLSDAHSTSLKTQSLLLKRVGEDTFQRVGVLEADWLKSDLDEQGRIAASGRTFTRTQLRIV